MSDRDVVMEAIRATENRYYVYILRKPDGTPFYVGKGVGERILRHERAAKSTAAKSHRLNTIRKIWRDGGEVVKEIVSRHETDEEACRREVELIAQLGRRDLGTGQLVNQTPGGDQGAGHLGPEARARQGDAIRKGLADPAVRKKMSEISKRRLADPVLRATIAAGVKRWLKNNPDLAEQYKSRRAATLRSPVHRLRNKQRAIEQFQREGERERQSARLKKFYAENPEVLAKLSERMRHRLVDPSVREHLAKTRTKWNSENPEAFAENERRRIEGLQRPEARAKQSEIAKRRINDNPEHLQKMREALKTPAAKASHAESQRRRFQNPEEKARMKRLVDAGKKKRMGVRLRCLALLEKHGLTPPSGHASTQAWLDFEKRIKLLVGEQESPPKKIRLKNWPIQNG